MHRPSPRDPGTSDPPFLSTGALAAAEREDRAMEWTLATGAGSPDAPPPVPAAAPAPDAVLGLPPCPAAHGLAAHGLGGGLEADVLACPEEGPAGAHAPPEARAAALADRAAAALDGLLAERAGARLLEPPRRAPRPASPAGGGAVRALTASQRARLTALLSRVVAERGRSLPSASSPAPEGGGGGTAGPDAATAGAPAAAGGAAVGALAVALADRISAPLRQVESDIRRHLALPDAAGDPGAPRAPPREPPYENTEGFWRARAAALRSPRQVLEEWFWMHFLRPLPTLAEKEMLARCAGLTVKQVDDWFVNARVRRHQRLVRRMADEAEAARGAGGAGAGPA